MRGANSIRIGETVQCRCPDGNYTLPDGLPNEAVAKVVAVYASKTHVMYGGKTFKVSTACIHPIKAAFPSLNDAEDVIVPPPPSPMGEQPPAT